MTNQETISILSELKKCYLGGIVDALDFAIEAVKAQEPVKRKQYDSFDYLCGSCNRVISRRYDYCPWCGRAVKRDG